MISVLGKNQEQSTDVVTSMLEIFIINVCALLDPGDTLSFGTHLLSMKFDILYNILIEPFSVTTFVGNSVIAKRVYKEYPIMFSNRVTMVVLVEHNIIDFDVTLVMDC